MKTTILTSILALLLCWTISAQSPGETEFQKAETAMSQNNLQIWFAESQKAADKGHSGGMYYLALAYDPMYAEKIPIPKEKSDKRAFEYYKKASDAGHADAAYATGELYRFGEGTTKDDNMALVYYKKAFELGHPQGGSTVYQMLGQNAKAYLTYLEDCVKRGNFGAANELGIIYFRGDIVTSNVQEAKKWLEIGEKNNHAESTYTLGYLYRNGFKVAEGNKITLNNPDADIPKAIQYFEKAANLGSVTATYVLGDIYFQGLETKADAQKSFAWFDKACNMGNGYSCYMCSLLISQRNVDKPMEEGGTYLTKSLKLGYEPTKK